MSTPNIPTPRTDALQRIQFEGCTCVVAAPEDIEALERENVVLRDALEGLLEPDFIHAIGSDEDSERSLVYCRMKAARAALTPPTTI